LVSNPPYNVSYAILCYAILCYIVCTRYVLPGLGRAEIVRVSYVLNDVEYDAVQRSGSAIRWGWITGVSNK
jgi:hypothetical protein